MFEVFGMMGYSAWYSRFLEKMLMDDMMLQQIEDLGYLDNEWEILDWYGWLESINCYDPMSIVAF